MFKKSILFLLLPAFALTFFVSSCATFNKSAVESVKNAAVLSVYADRRIDSSDFTGLGAAIAELAQNSDFKMDTEVAKLKDDLFNEYTKAFSFALMDEQTVLSSPNYATTPLKLGILTFDEKAVVCAPGYRPYNMMLKTAVLEALKGVPTADAAVMLYATYKLKKKFEILGFGTATVIANVSLEIKNKEFKTILYKYISAETKNTIKFALGGVFDAKLIQPLCSEATGMAAQKMKDWLLKQYAK